MCRRAMADIGILLFCVIATACSKAASTDKVGVRETNNAEENTMRDSESKAVRSGYEDSSQAITDYDKEEPGQDAAITMDVYSALPDKDVLMENIASYPAGSLINTKGLGEDELNIFFYSSGLDAEVKARIDGSSYREDCSVPYEELRYIRVLHIGFDDKTYIGELIVNRVIAEHIVEIFRELYNAGYLIERMLLIDEYNADDILSMEANNTSAFNFRYILGTTRLSRHSLGMAVDINPLYNPYVAYVDGEETVLPAAGAEYTNRSGDCPYYIREGDACYEAFTMRGFTWGGEWKSRKDYQHFEKAGD